jgi:ferredoxin
VVSDGFDAAGRRSGAAAALRVTVDDERCHGAGNCVLTAPEVFAQDEAGISWPLRDEPPAELHEAVREAADRCPVQAIRLLG